MADVSTAGLLPGKGPGLSQTPVLLKLLAWLSVYPISLSMPAPVGAGRREWGAGRMEARPAPNPSGGIAPAPLLRAKKGTCRTGERALALVRQLVSADGLLVGDRRQRGNGTGGSGATGQSAAHRGASTASRASPAACSTTSSSTGTSTASPAAGAGARAHLHHGRRAADQHQGVVGGRRHVLAQQRGRDVAGGPLPALAVGLVHNVVDAEVLRADDEKGPRS